MVEAILERIEFRKKELQKIKDKTDTEIQALTKEMQNDHQQIIHLEAQISELSERKKVRQIRDRIEAQQNLLKQYEIIRYRAMVKKSAPKIPVLKNAIAAFLVGGLICSLGQIVLNYFTIQGVALKEAGTITAAIMVFLGALLTGLGIYDEIGKFGGAGSMVPITGFANSIVSPALEFKREGYVYGVGAKVFTIAGPVLLYGILISVIIGLISYITM